MSGRALTAEYSRFLYALGKDDIANVCTFFDRFSSALHETKVFARFIHHPAITMAEKIETVQKLFGAIPDGVQSVLREILLKRKIALIPEITDRLKEIRDREGGVVSVQVTSAAELTEAQRGQLADSFSLVFKKTVDADYTTDPALIAGLRVQVGHTIYDNSVRNQLNTIREVLHSQSRG